MEETEIFFFSELERNWKTRKGKFGFWEWKHILTRKGVWKENQKDANSPIQVLTGLRWFRF